MKQSVIKVKWFWTLQVISGASLFIFVGAHIYLQHFVVSGGLRDFQQIVDYLSLWWALPFEWLFLVTVTAHAILGIRAILFDCGVKPKFVNTLSILSFILIVIYGTWLVLYILRWKGITFSLLISNI